jgi:hypothetical protein
LEARNGLQPGGTVATLELRPRSATEIIDASFQLLRTNYVALVTLSVATQLPLLAFRVMFLRVPIGGNATPAEIMQAMSGFWMVMPVVVLLAIAAQNTVTVAASQVYLGQRIDTGAAIRRGLMRFLWQLLTYLVLLPVMVVSFLLFVIPGIYVSLRLIPLNTVVVLEDLGPFETIRRTWALGKGRVGHMFVTTLLGLLIYLAVSVIGMIILGVVTAVLPMARDQNVSAIISTAVAAAIYPLILVIWVVLYYDLRIRNEGFDVEMMSKAMTV